MLPLTLFLLCLVSANAAPQPQLKSALSPTDTTSTIPNSPPILIPNVSFLANTKEALPDNSTITNAAPSGALPTLNTANLLYCLNTASITYKVGLQTTFYDAPSQKSEGVQFFTSGPPYYIFYIFFKKHTNSDGFWEDANLIGSTAGLNIGYNPTGKSLNFAERVSRLYDFPTVRAKCQEVFQFDVTEESFWGVYDDDLPALLTADE